MSIDCLNLRRQVLQLSENGHVCWQLVEERVTASGDTMALLLCDVWDTHSSRGARERLEVMIPRMNDVVRVARDAGWLIIHAPTGTMDFYKGHPARQRAHSIDPIEPTPILPATARDPDSLVGGLYAPGGTAAEYDPPLPVDASDGGSTTLDDNPIGLVHRQHAGITIDPQADLITDEGAVVYGALQSRQIKRMVLMGVHTNMCVLHRSFAIKAMAKRGIDMVLIRDLTDTMYNPARAPYVDHDEGTRLVVGYVEKFWGATTESGDLL